MYATNRPTCRKQCFCNLLRGFRKTFDVVDFSSACNFLLFCSLLFTLLSNIQLSWLPIVVVALVIHISRISRVYLDLGQCDPTALTDYIDPGLNDSINLALFHLVKTTSRTFGVWRRKYIWASIWGRFRSRIG